MLAALEIHQASTQGAVGHLLLTAANGGRDIQATCAGFFSILGHHRLSHHFGGVVTANTFNRIGWTDAHRGFFRCSSRGWINEAVFQHAINDVKLPCSCPFRVADGVECGWRLAGLPASQLHLP